ncbi:PBP1A family penicillin-binding protein [bacterium]|nr:PBP1A family penicillin-binding protein [bacterium]
MAVKGRFKLRSFGKKCKKISLLKKLLLAALCLFVCVIVAGIIVSARFKRELPSISTVSDYKPDSGTKVYSYDGELIAEFYHENRRNIVPYDKIPEKLRLAFVAGEDSSFYSHSGIDPLGIVRAGFKYLTTGIKQGGSTITQQLAKSFVGTERTYSRKIKDILLAMELERHLSKEEILYLYLNEVYLGSGSYGVEAASRKYFSKHVWELELDEMAILAGLPKFPSEASPLLNPDKSLRRRNYVLKRMFDDKYITQSEYEAALAKPVTTNVPKELFLDKAPYFSEKVRRYLLDKYGFDKLYKEGLTVQTTVDMRATMYAHEAVFYGIRELSKRQGYRRGEEESYQKGAKFAGEVTNPLYTIDLKKDLETYLKRHEKQFGKITEENIRSGVFYQGVVLETSEKKAMVQVGEVKKPIYTEDMQWAKPWNPTGYYVAIRSASDVLKPGDVVLVRATDKAGTKDVFDFRNYKKKLGNDFYFVLEQIPSSQAAMIVKDPYSGYVKALMGGYDFEISEFDRTTQACRQPGSAIKPIFYSLAMEKKGENKKPLFTPASLILDAPVTVTDTNFKPANFENTFKGEVTIWEALIHSMNTPAIRVLQKLTLFEAIEGAKALGIKSEIKPEFGSMLGSSCLTIDELTDAYAHFPNMGKSPHTTYIRKVYDKNGRTLEDNSVFYDPYISAPEKLERLIHFAKREENHVLTPQTAYITNKVLEDVVNRGTAASAKGLNHYKCQRKPEPSEEEGEAEAGICNRHVAGKTGTTNDYFDAWFIGYSPNFVAGVWVGNDQHGKPIGRVETGSKTALPIWRDFMERYLVNFPPTDYDIPSGVVGRNIDTKTGLLADPGQGVRMYFHSGTEPQTSVQEKDILDPSQSDGIF